MCFFLKYLLCLLCLFLFFYAGGWQLVIAQEGTEMGGTERDVDECATRGDAWLRKRGWAHYKSLSSFIKTCAN